MEKLSERLLSYVLLHQTEFHPSLLEQFANTAVVDPAKVYFMSTLRAMVKGKYPHIITKEKHSEKLHCHV